MARAIFHGAGRMALPLIRLPAPSPRERGEGICGTAAPQAGIWQDRAASSFSPPAGRRCRQADEGRPRQKTRPFPRERAR